MKLSKKETEVVARFSKILRNDFSDEIIDVLIFGSKAMGDATKESDIDILVITLSDDWEKVDKIRDIGYELDEEIDYRLSIQVISKTHFNYLRQNNFQFIKNVENEGVAI